MHYDQHLPAIGQPCDAAFINAPDSEAGWRHVVAIGEDSHPSSIEEQDKQDAANLYNTLTEQLIPMFFDRDANGVPREWIKRIRRAMATLVPKYNTWRMVQEYTQKYYAPK